MRTCVIFNPAAKGNKARRFHEQLDAVAAVAKLCRTAAAGDARRLAAQAIADGCDTVIAAGGDGTVNEVVNGMADANAFDRVRLGVLPLGTVNVFARELKIPADFRGAWALILRGRYTRMDVGLAEFSADGVAQRRYFTQLAGVGLDARAIELMDWELKKKIGALAYVAAGWKALGEPQPQVTVTAGDKWNLGELVLVGNGRLYGGRARVHPAANFRDGFLDVCLMPRVGRLSLAWSAAMATIFGELPERKVQRLLVPELNVAAVPPAGFELDGELVGKTPVKFSVLKEKLRVIVP